MAFSLPKIEVLEIDKITFCFKKRLLSRTMFVANSRYLGTQHRKKQVFFAILQYIGTSYNAFQGNDIALNVCKFICASTFS